MTAPSALALLDEVRTLGGHLTPWPPDRLEVVIPEPGLSRLLPAIRARKHDLLVLLQKPEGRCPAGHGPGYWQDAAGQWRCLDCEPNPGWRYLRGVTLEVLGNRPITLQPPTGDLPGPGSWAKTPAGLVVEAILYEVSGADVLTRELTGERLAWFPPEALTWEADWGWYDVPQASVRPAAVVPGKLCDACKALRWTGKDGTTHCDCDRPPQGGHGASCTCGRCRVIQ